MRGFWSGALRVFLSGALLLTVVGGMSATQHDADLMTAARAVGEVPAFENEHVRVRYRALEYPEVERRVAETRPVVLYVQVAQGPRVVTVRLPVPQHGTRPSWRPGVGPRAVHVELLRPPPRPSALGEPGTDPPVDSVEEDLGTCRLITATFRPQDYGVGTGRLPSVTVFLSDGAVEVWNRGLRRRMWVQAGSREALVIGCRSAPAETGCASPGCEPAEAPANTGCSRHPECSTSRACTRACPRR